MTFTSRRIREERPPSRWGEAAKTAGPIAMKAGALLVALYGKWKTRHDEEATHHRRVVLLKRIAIVLFSILLGLILLAGTVKALVAMRVLTLQTFFSVTGTDLPVDEHGFTNLLLLGAGDKDHDGIDLTDAIMVVSLDPQKTRSAVMLSLPRDLYALKTEKMGAGRVNELYRNYKGKLQVREKLPAAEASEESMKQLGQELGTLLGITIHRVAKVDFTAFVQVVDELGGVDIQVPYDIVDPEYPGPDYTFAPFEIKQGLQHLDGETALKYARSRHTTSDFGRAARQQQLLTALAEKARDSGIATSPGKITDLLTILSDHVETTMTVREMLGAGGLADRIDRANVISMQLNDQTGVGTPFVSAGGFLYAPPRDQFAGASVLLPVSIPEFPVTWKQIQAFVRMLTQHRRAYLTAPRLHILNAGAKSGLGRSLGNELLRYGFNVEEIDNAFEDRKTKLPSSVVIAQTPADEELAKFFASLLRLKTGPLPAGVPVEKQGQITILLGEEYQYIPLQGLLP